MAGAADAADGSLVTPGCHLCDDAKESRADRGRDRTSWTEVDIIGDPELEDDYAEMIPVIMLDGRMHGYFRVEEDRLLRDLRHGNRVGGSP